MRGFRTIKEIGMRTPPAPLLVAVFGLALLSAGCASVSSSGGNNSKGGNTIPLTVSITSPASGATESGTIAVTATASDSVAISSVQFQVDGANLGAAATAAPYTQSLNTATLTNGKHSLTAVATDASANKATSAAVSITVNNTQSNRPSVSITAPSPGTVLSGTVAVLANASDSSGIQSVQFLLDGSNMGPAITVAPYSQTW